MSNRRVLRRLGRGKGASAQPAGSLEADSLSLRHAAASGLTPDGQLERLSIEVDMAREPGWRGTVLRWWFRVGAVAAILFGLTHSTWVFFASRTLEGRANVTRRVYPGLHHETHNEPSGPAVIDDTMRWVIEQVEKIATR